MPKKKSKPVAAAAVDPRIEKLRIIKERTERPNIELAFQIGIREATLSTMLKAGTMGNARFSTKKLVDHFIQQHQHFFA